MKEAIELINETIRDIEETEKIIECINRKDKKREVLIWSVAAMLFVIAIALIIYSFVLDRF